ncbi:unnamed protein product [Effrenium voratum]|uniref:Uncharacterized protein n=1 Tax=Effrenium voratum TaxID=2562239 RepID=A0AA36NBQ5_9DINO|nr:unnamed protein product [Effrenium voratum]
MQLLAKEPSLALENPSEDMAPVLDMRKLTEARVGVEEQQQQEAIQAEPKRMALGNVLQLAESEAKGDPGSPQHPESGPRSEKELCAASFSEENKTDADFHGEIQVAAKVVLVLIVLLVVLQAINRNQEPALQKVIPAQGV